MKASTEPTRDVTLTETQHSQTSHASHSVRPAEVEPSNDARTRQSTLWRTMAACVVLSVVLALGILLLQTTASTSAQQQQQQHGATRNETGPTVNATVPHDVSLTDSLNVNATDATDATDATASDMERVSSTTISLDLVGLSHELDATGNATLSYACHVALDSVVDQKWSTVQRCVVTHQTVVQRRLRRRHLNAQRQSVSTLRVDLWATLAVDEPSFGDVTAPAKSSTPDTSQDSLFLDALTTRLSNSADPSFQSLVSVLLVNEPNTPNGILFNCTVHHTVVQNRTSSMSRPP